MKARSRIAAMMDGFLTAVQFLTRIPVPEIPYSPESLQRSLSFFPVVGLLMGLLASSLYWLVSPHLPHIITAVAVVIFQVVLTGALHEDAVADAADGFGGGNGRDHILAIFRDSRVGSYGATAVCLALIARVSLIASLPPQRVLGVLTSAIVLSRASVLPFSYCLPPAHTTIPDDAQPGQGSRIAALTSRTTLVFGIILAFAIVALCLRTHALPAVIAATLVTLLTGVYYHRRIGGVTGDCFGATIQLVEIAVLFTGVWTV